MSATAVQPAKRAATELAARAAERELRRRHAENPLRWVIPPTRHLPQPFEWMPKQLEACEGFGAGMLDQPPTFDAFKNGCGGVIRFTKLFGYLAGNRAGKTEWAARIVIGCALGLNPARLHELPQDPLRWPLGPPRLIWPITTTKEKSRETQQKYIWDRVPKGLVAGSTTWNQKSGYHNNVLPLRNGSRLVFRSAEQELRTFEGDPIHLAWVDEEIPLRYVLATIKRLADHQGPLIWTTWPNKPELRDVFVDRQLDPEAEKLPETDVGYVTAGMADNIYLPAEEVERQTRLTDPTEKAGRIDGRFSFNEGLVYPMFSEALHVRGETPFPIPYAQWTVDEVIDPGWDNPCAVLFCCVDERNIRGVYDEIYERHRTVGEIAALIYARRWKHYGKLTGAELMEFERKAAAAAPGDGAGLQALAASARDLKALIDAYRRRCGDCRPRRTIVDEYSRQRDQAKVDMLRQLRDFDIPATAASNQDKAGQRSRLREALRPLDGIVRLWFAWNCPKTRWEFQHHRMAKPLEATGEHKGDIERVVDGNNHAISCCEYWITSNPQYVPPEQRPAQPGSVMERHQELQRAKKRTDDWRRLG